MQSQAESYFALKGTAREIWDLLATPTTVNSLCSRLSLAHSIEKSAIQDDVVAFLTELSDAGLIRING